MSFHTNDNQQQSMFDRCGNMTDREKYMLVNSWAAVFANEIFPAINEQRFNVLYANKGRPNTPVNVNVGALIIKDILGLTDEELVEGIVLNAQIQYALHLTSFNEIPYSDRTPSRFRERLSAHVEATGEDLLKEEVLSLAEIAKARLHVSDKLKRMDSLMISSNCKRMARLELMYTCTANMVSEYLKRSGKECKLPDRLVRYTKAEDKNATIYRAKNEEVEDRLQTVIGDAILIKAMCSDQYDGCREYEQLKRVLDDQTVDGVPKAGKDVKPTSLQNPSDPDATFRKKAGKSHTGYVGNIVESCDKEHGNIIDGYSFEQNIYSDQTFAAEVIEDIGKAGEEITLVADGAYQSEANFDAAEESDVKLVTTNLTGSEPNGLLLGFELDGDDIVRCPAGNVPYDTSYNEKTGTLSAYFAKHTCDGCPHRGQCPVVEQRKRMAVRFTDTAYNRAVYAADLQTKEYKMLANFRNGVEGIPSVLRRKYKVDSMPVFGLKDSRIWFGFKIAAINATRLIDALKPKAPAAGEVCLCG